MEVITELHGVKELLADLRKVHADIHTAMAKSMTRIGFIAHREAVRYAPESPSQEIINALRKTKRKVKRNARATSRPSPGGLRRSIAWRATSDEAMVFVDANSEAGQYAAKIHDEKGVTWQNRGPRTIQLGPQADEKFIERAIFDNEGNFVDIIKSELRKVIQ